MLSGVSEKLYPMKVFEFHNRFSLRHLIYSKNQNPVINANKSLNLPIITYSNVTLCTTVFFPLGGRGESDNNIVVHKVNIFNIHPLPIQRNNNNKYHSISQTI